MAITSRISDFNNRSTGLRVDSEGAASVTIHSHPPKDEEISSLPFRSYFLNGASNDMRVNGSTTNVAFSINASADYDYYIKNISIKLADAGATFAEFANLAALTNGVQFVWQSRDFGELIIHEGIKTNLEFFRLTNQTPTIIDLSGGGADAVLVNIDLTDLVGSQWGVRLQKNTTDSLFFRVKDNLGTGIDSFNIIGYGIKI